MNSSPANITVRHPTLDYTDIPPYYFAGNPLLSYVLTSLSILFPLGERMFVKSVRTVRDQIEDPVLQKNISGFIGQEAVHSHIHHAFNEFAKANQGLNVDRFTRAQAQRIAIGDRLFNPKINLAFTSALEHITAILGAYILEHPEFLDGLDERVKPLWMWHAIEEIEHKAVAFDVYQKVYNDQWTRYAAMVFCTALFSVDAFATAVYFTLTDKQARPQLKQHVKALSKLRGAAWAMAPEYIRFFRRSFHPNQKDDQPSLTKWQSYIKEKLAV